jgi:hypothetical protein
MWSDSVSRVNASKLRVRGEPVVYTAPPSDPVTLTGIPETPMRDDDSSAYKRIWFPIEGFDPQVNDQIEHNAVKYRIVKAHPDELGGIWVTLEKI